MKNRYRAFRLSFLFERAMVLITLVALLGCVTNSRVVANENTTKLTIQQAKPSLVHVDLGQEGQTHGDMLAFDAEVTTETGVKGKLSGILFTVDIPEKNHEVFQDRIVNMVFDLGAANTLVICGKSVYPNRDEPEMAKNNPQIRAVIGGTGIYIGARGQIATIRNDDGTYTHRVELVD